MIKRRLLLKFLIAFLLIPPLSLVYPLLDSAFVYSAAECPSGMTAKQCLDYLTKESEKLNDQKSEISTKINEENQTQETLNSKIASLKNQIEETELIIAEKENLIARKTIEIEILTEDIVATQKKIDSFTEEIKENEAIVQKQALESYKSRFYSPLEAVINADDFTSMVRRLKYLETIRADFKIALNELEQSRTEQEDAQKLLKTQKEEIEKIKEDIETEKVALEEEDVRLQGQKGEQQTLLAESEKTEEQYAADLAVLKKKADEYDAKISQIIIELYNEGQIPVDRQVKKGDIVGFQGHTGWAYGSHLHFSVISNGYYVNPVGSYVTASGSYIYPGTFGAPLATTFATQFYSSWHRAIDAVSLAEGNGGDKYYIKKGDLICDPNYSGWHYLRGEGAPVRAMADGVVTKSRTDSCGGKYVVIDHGDGNKTLYLHLK